MIFSNSQPVYVLLVKSGLRLNPFVPRLNMHSTYFKAAINQPKLYLPSSPVLRIFLVFRIIFPVSVFIHLSFQPQQHNTIREQRTVLCTYRYSNSDLPDLKSCVFTTTPQGRTCSTQHSSFHCLLFYYKSVDILV